MLFQFTVQANGFASEPNVERVAPDFSVSDVLGEEKDVVAGTPCEDAGYLCRPPHHGQTCRDVGGVSVPLSCGHPGTGYHCCDR